MDKMEKMMEEEELKGLEEEIDDAVDRLFVEKKGGMVESFLMESPPAEPPLKTPVVEPSIEISRYNPFYGAFYFRTLCKISYSRTFSETSHSLESLDGTSSLLENLSYEPLKWRKFLT